MATEQNSEQFEVRDVRIKTSKEQWAAFDAWRARKGYQTGAEAFRALMDNVNKDHNHQLNETSQPASGAG